MKVLRVQVAHAHAKLELEEKAHFALLSKRESITSKMLTMVKNAEREFDIACSGRKIMPFIHTFAEQLRRIIKKGVKIRIISHACMHSERAQCLPCISFITVLWNLERCNKDANGEASDCGKHA